MGEQRLAYLDALRGLAIFGVLVVHTSQPVLGLPLWLDNLGASGARGVQLFYMVSAFTLLTVSRHGLDPVRFFTRRFFRIAPMFYLAIGAYLLMHGLGPRYYAPEGIGAGQVVITAAFLHGWRPDAVNAIVPGGWSIACEWMFYLAFPLLHRAITDLKRACALFVVTCAIALLTIYVGPRLIAGPHYLVHDFLYFSIFAQGPVFAAGFVVFFAAQRWRASSPLLVGLVALACAALMGAVGGRLSHYLLSIFPLALLTWALASADVAELLNNAALRFLGTISYSLYLIHHLILDPLVAAYQFHGLWGWGQLFAVVFWISALIASLTHKWIELPGIGLGRRLTSAPRVSQVGAA